MYHVGWTLPVPPEDFLCVNSDGQIDGRSVVHSEFVVLRASVEILLWYLVRSLFGGRTTPSDNRLSPATTVQVTLTKMFPGPVLGRFRLS